MRTKTRVTDEDNKNDDGNNLIIITGVIMTIIIKQNSGYNHNSTSKNEVSEPL